MGASRREGWGEGQQERGVGWGPAGDGGGGGGPAGLEGGVGTSRRGGWGGGQQEGGGVALVCDEQEPGQCGKVQSRVGGRVGGGRRRKEGVHV